MAQPVAGTRHRNIRVLRGLELERLQLLRQAIGAVELRNVMDVPQQLQVRSLVAFPFVYGECWALGTSKQRLGFSRK